MMTAATGPLPYRPRPVCPNASYRAIGSPASTNSMFGTSGSNGVRMAGFQVADNAPSVRPWNPWVSAMMRAGLPPISGAAPGSVRPYSLASFRAASLPSVPELPKYTCEPSGAPASLTRRAASSICGSVAK